MSNLYKYFLLDWDGNMINTLPIWLDGYKECAKYYNKNFSTEFIVGNIFGKLDAYKIYGEKTREEFDEVLFEKFIRNRLKDAELFPNVYDTLKKLHSSGVKMAIVSTSTKDVILPIMKKYAISDLVDCVVAGEDVENHKPHPEPLLKAMSMIEAKKEHTVIVGDGDKDIVAGQAVGIDTIIHYPKINQLVYPKELIASLDATYVVENFDEILKFVYN